MASIIYDHYMSNVYAQAIKPAADTVYNLLVTSSYTPSKPNDQTQADVTNEVSGTGYTTGGQAVTQTVTLDTVNHREDVSFANSSWTGATFSTAAAVIVTHAGAPPSGNPLWAYVDFGGTVSVAGGTLTVSYTTPLRLQN